MGILPMAAWLNVSRQTDAVVVRNGTRLLSRACLRAQVVALVRQLDARPEQRWALCFDDSGAFLVALLATLHAGRTPVIPGNLQEAALREQGAYFDAMLTDRPALQRSLGGLDLTMLDAPMSATSATQTDELPPLSPQASLELFTSGSTGAPRRVVKTVAAMDREAAWLAAQFGVQLAGCTVVASVTHQHLYGLTFRIFLPMALMLRLHARQILYPEALGVLPCDQPLAFISSPAFLKRLDVRLHAPDVQWLLSAGGVLAGAMLGERLIGWGWWLMKFMAARKLACWPGANANRWMPVGRPLAPSSFRRCRMAGKCNRHSSMPPRGRCWKISLSSTLMAVSGCWGVVTAL